ncbi:MAG: hypothetical protein GX663_02185 [Clostridiales bacterium]|nr:hypothetical protein [Clostridiales bacterium]
MIVQKIYLPILNFIYKFTGRLNEKVRNVLMVVCLAIEIISTYVYQIDEFLGFICPAMINTLVGIAAFGGMMIFSINGEMKPIGIRRIILYPMMLCGVIVFISGIHHYIGYSYMCLGLFMAFVMPAYILIWGNRKDFDSLFKPIAFISVALFVIYFVANCIAAPMTNPECFVGGRYSGLASDPNGIAKTAVVSCLCAIYILYTAKSKWKYTMVPIISMSIAMTILTVSRANLLALIIVIVFSVIFLLKKILINKDNKLHEIIALVCMIAIVAMLVPVFSKCFELKQYNASAEATVEQNAPVDVEERILISKGQDGKADYNALSSGRIGIWKYCLDNVSIFGNNVENGVVLKKDIGKIEITQDHTHNTTIELLHRSGVFAGLTFFILEFACAVWVISRVLVMRKNKPYEVFAVLSITAFGIASLFDIVVLPFAKITVLLFYICLAAIAMKEKLGASE